MAVGESEDDVQPHILALRMAKAKIACIDSPSRTTMPAVSGKVTTLDELYKILEEKKLITSKPGK